MGWNTKYWEIVYRYFWRPADLGFISVKSSEHGDPDGTTSRSGNPTIYKREGQQWEKTEQSLNRDEEALNDIFDLTFSIASDKIINKLLFNPVGISSTGPFQSLTGREINRRYGWRDTENVVFPDGYFISDDSILIVEMKLGARTSFPQLAKYIALLTLEELSHGRRKHVGLLTIVPGGRLSTIWKEYGLKQGVIDDQVLARMATLILNKRIQQVFDLHQDDIISVGRRLRLAAVSWGDIREGVSTLINSFGEGEAGDQTLRRLLGGFRDQLDQHGRAGLSDR